MTAIYQIKEKYHTIRLMILRTH